MKVIDLNKNSFQDSYVPMNVTNGINTYDDFFNLLDENSRGQLETISRKSHLFGLSDDGILLSRKKKHLFN